MRAALLAALLLAPLAAAVDEPYLVLLDWQEGRTLVGTTSLIVSPLAPGYEVGVPECYPHLLADVLYAPEEFAAGVEGVGEAALKYDFLVQLLQAGEPISQVRVRQPGYGWPIGTVDEPGAHEVRLSLATGVDVAWEFRVRTRFAFEDPACNPPVGP